MARGTDWRETEEGTVLRWLRHQGIAHDFFKNTESEHDADLASYFVEPPNYKKALDPVHTVFLAQHGEGKTATRKRIEAQLQGSFMASRRLAFSYVIPVEVAENPPADLNGHLPYMLAAAVRAAFLTLAQYGPTLEKLQEDDVLAGRFARFFDLYYPTRDWAGDLKTCIEERSLLPCLDVLRPEHTRLDDYLPYGVRWLKQWDALLRAGRLGSSLVLIDVRVEGQWAAFCALLAETGVKSMEMLVDGVDAKGEQGSEEHLARIVGPLAAACHNAALGASVTIKLFLPLQLGKRLLTELAGIRKTRLAWTPQRLRQLINARLLAASGGKVRSLWELAKLDIDVDMEALEDRVIRQARRRPRILLQAVRELFALAAQFDPLNDPAIGKEVIALFRKAYTSNR